MVGRDEGRELTLARLRALSEHSLRRAGDSLTALLGHSVRLAVTGLAGVPATDLPGLVTAGDAGPLAGLRFQITGEASGQMVILFPLRTIHRMLRVLLGERGESASLSGEERSAVQEVGNILASAFLSGLGDLLGRRLLPTPPEIHLDDSAGLVQQVMAALQEQQTEVLVIQALFEDPEQRIEGRFFVLPEMASLEAMVRGVAAGGNAGTSPSAGTNTNVGTGGRSEE